MSFKVKVIQFDIKLKNQTTNRDKIYKLISSNDTEKTDLFVLPETFTTGFDKEIFDNVTKYAETESGKTINMLKQLALEYNTWIVCGTIIEKDNSNYYNTSFLINNKGMINGKYRKMHLFSPCDEDKAITNGENLPVFNTKLGRLAIMTCYDIRFVEISRLYSLKGTEAIIVVANFPKPKINHWRTLLQARAIENQIYIIACNRIGKNYFGHSLIIDPWGEIIEEGNNKETIISGIIDVNKIKEVRNKIPMYKDRHPENYSF